MNLTCLENRTFLKKMSWEVETCFEMEVAALWGQVWKQHLRGEWAALVCVFSRSWFACLWSDNKYLLHLLRMVIRRFKDNTRIFIRYTICACTQICTEKYSTQMHLLTHLLCGSLSVQQTLLSHITEESGLKPGKNTYRDTGKMLLLPLPCPPPLSKSLKSYFTLIF